MKCLRTDNNLVIDPWCTFLGPAPVGQALAMLAVGRVFARQTLHSVKYSLHMLTEGFPLYVV